ncbi:MAG: hypothetical protein IKI22_05395, partial [Neisseriaceae bacterium]|nr:hypothetical protein [Neisseriaceae bacterium]
KLLPPGLAITTVDSENNGLGIIDPNTKITVVGHSLGGHLASAFSRLFPDNTEHAYIFNAPGFKIKRATDERFAALNPDSSSSFNKDMITNHIANKGWSVTATTNEEVGKVEDTFIEDVDDDGIDLIGWESHAIYQLVDTLSVGALLEKIDGSFNNINVMNQLLEHVSNNHDNGTLEDMLNALSLFFNIPYEILPNNRETLHHRIDFLNGIIEEESISGRIISLAELSADAIVSIAMEDSYDGMAIRYALQKLNAFAILPNNQATRDYYDLHNNNINNKGCLNLASRENPNGMSTHWMEDRIEMLLLKMKYNENDTSYNFNESDEISAINYGIDSGIAGIAGDWQYIEQSKDGYLSFLTIDGTGVGRDYYRKFAADGVSVNFKDNKLEGHLYGSYGDDTLTANSVKDRLEGGAGYDSYYAVNGTIIYDSDGRGKIVFNVENAFDDFHVENAFDDSVYTFDSNNGKIHVYYDGLFSNKEFYLDSAFQVSNNAYINTYICSYDGKDYIECKFYNSTNTLDITLLQHKNQTITIEDFHDGDFGINLNLPPANDDNQLVEQDNGVWVREGAFNISLSDIFGNTTDALLDYGNAIVNMNGGTLHGLTFENIKANVDSSNQKQALHVNGANVVDIGNQGDTPDRNDVDGGKWNQIAEQNGYQVWQHSLQTGVGIDDDMYAVWVQMNTIII